VKGRVKGSIYGYAVTQAVLPNVPVRTNGLIGDAVPQYHERPVGHPKVEDEC